MTDGVRIVRSDRRKLQQLIRETPGKADELLRAAATEMVGDIVESFGTGVTMGAVGRDARGRFTKRERTSTPSKPGDPPNVQTGELRASIRAAPDGKLRVLIHDGVEYGAYLELGTNRMAARPFINPVFEEWRQGKFGRFVRDFGVYD